MVLLKKRTYTGCGLAHLRALSVSFYFVLIEPVDKSDAVMGSRADCMLKLKCCYLQLGGRARVSYLKY